MASNTFCGICAPAALSKNTELPARFRAGNFARTAATGNCVMVASSPPGARELYPDNLPYVNEQLWYTTDMQAA